MQMLSHRFLPAARISIRQLSRANTSTTAPSILNQHARLHIQTSRLLSTVSPSSSNPSDATSSSSSSEARKPYNPHSDAAQLSQLDLSRFGPDANATQIAQKILEEESAREKYRSDTRKSWVKAQIGVLATIGLMAWYNEFKWVNPFKPFEGEEQASRKTRTQAPVAALPSTEQVRAPTSFTEFLQNPLGSFASLMPKRRTGLTPEEREKIWMANLERSAQAQTHTMKIEAQKHGRSLEEHQRLVEKAGRSI